MKLLNPNTMGSYQVDLTQKYGGIWKTNIFFRPTVFCTSDDSIQSLASEEAQKDLQAFFPPHHQKLFGKYSIIVQSGAVHDRIRRLLQPSLSPAAIKSYRPLVETSIHNFLQDHHSSDFEPMVPKLRSFFISLMLTVVLGGESSERSDITLAKDLEIWSRGLLAAPLTFLPWSTAAKAVRARRRIVDRLESIIDTKSYREGGLMAKLCQAESDETLSHAEIIDNLLTLVFAGSDTTAAAAVSLWKHLSLPNSKTSEDDASALVQCILEIYPSAPFTMRITKEELQLGDCRVPANWLVVYGLAGALTTSKQDGAIEQSLAFGAGPRKCPGRWLAAMELTIFAKELRGMQWELKPNQNLEQRYTPGFFPLDGFQVKFV
jgi:cytochrome P450